MRRSFILAALFLPLAFAASCTAPDPFPSISSLRFASETRPVAAGTHGLEIDGPIDVTLVVGATPTLTIEANDNLLPRITSEARDGVLHLGLRGWTMGVTQLKARLALPQVDTIRVSGVGGVEAAGFAGGPLDVAVSGTGDVRVAGFADRLSVSLTGVGSVNAEALAVADAQVTTTGVGSIKLQATRTLAVTRGGIGSVTYRGEPQVTVTGKGIGEVRPARS